MADDSLLAFAGLWDRWRDPEGRIVQSCTILTTTPNPLLTDVHDRMPVILTPQHSDVWLDPGFKNVKEPSGILKPFDATAMKRYPVSTRVNLVANDDPQCAEIAVVDPGNTKSAQLWLANVDMP